MTSVCGRGVHGVLFVFELWSYYVAQAGFEPAVILPRSLECWDCWRATLYPSCPSIVLLKRVRRLGEMESPLKGAIQERMSPRAKRDRNHHSNWELI